MKNWIIWSLLSLVLIASFLIRVLPNYRLVFQPSMVIFNEVDPWYHMRLVDYMAVNFPAPLIWDQYATLGGASVGYYPLMAWIIISISILTGIDYNIIGAFLPPIAACLCLLLIFLISSTIFKASWLGLGSALIASILPSQFLQRSVLGNTDHHILEVLFLLLSTFFLIKFSENSKIRYSILSGLSLSLYFTNWWGSLMVLVPLGLWALVTNLNFYTKNISTLKFNLGVILLLSLISISLLVIKESLVNTSMYLYSLGTLTGLSLLLLALSYLKRPYYFSILGLILVLGLTVSIHTGIFIQVIELSKYALGTLYSTIGEAAPMDIYKYFDIYNVAALLVLPGLYIYTKKRFSYLFLILTLFFFTLSIFQIRWSYYLIISISILCSYFIYWLSQQVAKNFKAPIYTVALLMLLIPSIKGNIQMVTSPLLLNPAWGQALIWLNINTPQPYTSPSAYTEPNPGKPKYTILSWWDYGHWIIRIGQRVPLTSPTIQGIPKAKDYAFLTAQSPEEAKKYLVDLKVKYIIIDKDMVEGKFYAIIMRQAIIPQSEIPNLYEKAMVRRLYTTEVEGYKLVYDNGVVKILEVLDYEKVSLGK